MVRVAEVYALFIARWCGVRPADAMAGEAVGGGGENDAG
jgi:hypothetical protein